MKKLASLACTFALLSTTAMADFSDVGASHPNQTAINTLTELEIVDGNPDGTFSPDNFINRAEITKMVVEMQVGDPKEMGKYEDCFNDVSDQWFAPHVCYAEKQGWVTGYEDGNFKPSQNVNRAEALKIILNAYYNGESNIPQAQTSDWEVFADINPDEWYFNFFEFTYSNDLLDLAHIEVADTAQLMYSYEIDQGMRRYEVAETIYRLLDHNGEIEVDLVDESALGEEYKQITDDLHQWMTGNNQIAYSPIDIELDGIYAKITIMPTETITDNATVWLKMNNNETWEVIIGPTTSVDQDTFTELGIPESLQY